MLRSRRLLRLLALLALVLLIAGMVTPLLTLTRFWMFDEQLSILSGIFQLWQQGHYPLALLILLLSVVLPVLKLLVLFRLLQLSEHPGPRLQRLLQLIHEYGRWAMLDVMVVAMLIVTVKLGVILSVQVHYGLYLFATAVLLTMLVTRQTVKLLQGR